MKPKHARRISCFILLVCGSCALGSRSAAQSQVVTSGAGSTATYIVFDAPDAAATTVTGMNDGGDVVGYFQDAQTSTTRGFVRAKDGSVVAFDAAPNAASTLPAAINAAGDVTGAFFDAIGLHSFLRHSQGDTTTFDVPQAGPRDHEVGAAMAIDNSDVIAGFMLCVGCDTWVGFVRDRQGNITSFESIQHGSVPTSINEQGKIAGVTSPFWASEHGFVRDPDGVITTFEVVDPDPGSEAHPLAINNRGDVAGYYFDPQTQTTRGFVRDRSGKITAFAASASASQTRPGSMNESDEVVGDFTDGTGSHNFLLSAQGAITVFDVPNASGAHAVSINNRGDVAGNFLDTAAFRTHGFVRFASPSN